MIYFFNLGDFMSKGMLLKIVEGHPKTALNAIRSPTNSSIYPERKVRMKKMTKKMKIYKLINAQFVYVVSFRFMSIFMMLKNNRLHIAYLVPLLKVMCIYCQCI